MDIPTTEFSEQGPLMHFAHANGYLPGAYLPLMESLTPKYHILAMHMRPLWGTESPEEINDWEPFARDLLAFLDGFAKGAVIGMGHSIGATITLMAALDKPELFKALILIDPVIFPRWMGFYWEVIDKLGLVYALHPLTKGALRRRTVYPSREAMFESYRKKAVFQNIDDRGLKIIIQSITEIDQEGNAALKYPPKWEARIYATGILRDHFIWKKLGALKIPLLIIYGDRSNAFWQMTANKVHQTLPAASLVRIPDASHLVPFEKPQIVSKHAAQFIDSLSQSGS